MAGITTSFLTSLKREMFAALHCFNATVTPTANTTNGSFGLAALSALTGLAVGMALSGTGIPAGTVIASIDSSNTLTMSKAATATNTGVTVTAAGDIFKIALIIPGMAGTYSAASSNYTDITGNSDEVVGAGYTAGGLALVNISPVISGNTAFVDFGDASWTSATISARGCMIYNTNRRGSVATPACSVHDFGGTQSVTAGTLTLVFPVADASNAILRIS